MLADRPPGQLLSCHNTTENKWKLLCTQVAQATDDLHTAEDSANAVSIDMLFGACGDPGSQEENDPSCCNHKKLLMRYCRQCAYYLNHLNGSEFRDHGRRFFMWIWSFRISSLRMIRQDFPICLRDQQVIAPKEEGNSFLLLFFKNSRENGFSWYSDPGKCRLPVTQGDAKQVKSKHTRCTEPST